MELSGFLLILLAYCLGSISSAVLICRLFRLNDPRDAGSGNPGATNVLRVAGKKAALLTLTGDVLKGVIPVSIALQLQFTSWIVGFVAVAAFLGHLFPLFFRFKGGKGVATFFGVLFVYNTLLAIYAVLLWLICAWSFRISSLSALITSMTIPFFAWFFFPQQFSFLTFMSILLVMRHHQNIKNLLSGEENLLGRKHA